MGLLDAWSYVASVDRIDLDALEAAGVRCILIDRDNTCVPRDAKTAPPEILAWLDEARGRGFTTCIVSNNFHSKQVERSAAELGCEVLNQGVGGQVFQIQSLGGMAAAGSPKHVIIAFGANYRYEACEAEAVRKDIRRYLAEVSELWPKVPTWVITPFGFRDGPFEQHPQSCFDELVEIISDEAARHSQMRTVVGSGLLPARKRLLADGYEHPNAEGNAHIAERLLATIRRSGEVLRRKANPSERSFVRDEKTGRFVADPERKRGLDLEGIDLDDPELDGAGELGSDEDELLMEAEPIWDDLEEEGDFEMGELETTAVLRVDPKLFEPDAEAEKAPHWEDLDV